MIMVYNKDADSKAYEPYADLFRPGHGDITYMFADGTLAGGVNDEGVGGAAISVAARFEEGRLNLYLNDRRLVVTRYLDGDDLVWCWGPYANHLHRLTSP